MLQKGQISTKGIVWTAVVLFLIVGGVIAGINKKSKTSDNKNNQHTEQSGTPEGGRVSLAYSGSSQPAGAVFYDAGPHGWHAVQQGGGTFMQYDGTRGLSYKSDVVKAADGGYSVAVPADICGDIVLPQGSAVPPAKVVEVTLLGADGKPLAGTQPQKVEIKCDIYRLIATIKANPDKLLADGIAASTVTANFSVSGPAKFINSQRIPFGSNRPVLTTPLGLMEVHFNASMGALNPSPANVKTDLLGNATVSITSSDAGIAKVMAQASGVGDAQVNVHFLPKITAVKEDFVPPTSPTNYEIQTIPANPKDLTIDWKFLPAPGVNCGHMTGALSGLGLNKNGFYHGPEDRYKDGCPEDWEHASKIQVTVTDKDGGSDSRTFSARDLEGQGFVKFQ